MMAKKAMIERELKRQAVVERYAAKRAELKAMGDYEGLSKLPRNASSTRLHNRCKVTAAEGSPSVNLLIKAKFQA